MTEDDQEERDERDDSINDPSGSGHEVLLQGFNWESHSLRDRDKRPCWLHALGSKADAIAEAGVTAVWLPPPCFSISDQGYMPQDYDSLNTAYGSEEDAKGCIEALHAHSLKAIADIVINHRCAQQKGPDGKWNQYTGRYAWSASCIVSNQAEQYGGTGAFKQEEVFEPAPNLDHSQERVRNDIKQWLSWLRQDFGFDGIRLDFSKGYSGSYVKEYVDAAAAQFTVGEFWTDCVYGPSGLDYNQDPHRQRIVDWCDASSGSAAAFDFTTKGILQQALEAGQYWRLRDPSGKPPGVMGWWPSRAVTFIDNHDTGPPQNHWPFPPAFQAQGYAYILTHPGTPCIFYDHLMADGAKRSNSVWGSLKRLLTAGSLKSQPSLQPAPSAASSGMGVGLDRMSSAESTGTSAMLRRHSATTPKRSKGNSSPQALRAAILDLIALRKRAGLHCRSKVTIHEADDSLYAATLDNKVAMKLGPRSWSPDAAGLPAGNDSKGVWQLTCSGVDWAVWEARSSVSCDGSGSRGRRQREATAPLAIPCDA